MNRKDFLSFDRSGRSEEWYFKRKKKHMLNRAYMKTVERLGHLRKCSLPL